MTINKKQIINALKKCYDPELQIDLWSMGLIYNIDIKQKNNKPAKIIITMTFTTPACALGPLMMNDIKEKIEKLKSVKSCEIKLTFDPPWKPEMMTEQARAKIGFFPVSSDDN